VAVMMVVLVLEVQDDHAGLEQGVPAPLSGAKTKQLAAGPADPILLPGKRFLQEDCAPQIADAVLQLARSAGRD
jgi:hypothetical protein